MEVCLIWGHQEVQEEDVEVSSWATLLTHHQILLRFLAQDREDGCGIRYSLNKDNLTWETDM